MSLSPGTRLGQYEILSPLGKGGMGEVWRARDTRLGREVALKLLPGDFAADPERHARFEREARLLAALNHPNVAVLYGLEHLEGRHALAMELVEGEGLDEIIARGPVPVERALAIARQLADALAAAHEKGIVHRDFKPANVRIRSDGAAKVLDFGLAKEVGPPAAQDPLTSPTRSAGLTVAGAILGTVPYLSPEQARGHDVDERTDVWAFGCVLYEMLTGRRAFEGGTASDTLAGILVREADLAWLPPETPEAVVALIRSTLRKDVRERVLDRDALRPEPAVEVAGPPRLTQITSAEGVEEFPAFAPDGHRIVFARDEGGVRRLVLLDLATRAEETLTAGGCDEIQPAFAPDGRGLYFVRSREAGARLEPNDVFGVYERGDLWLLELETRRETRLAEAAFNPAVSRDGRRIAFDASWGGPRRLWTADPRGRNPRQATDDASEAVAHVRPRWSPDGGKLVFQNIERTKLDIRVADIAGGGLVWITNDLALDLHPVWHPAGRAIVFSSQRSGGLNLWSVPVDAQGRASGRLRQLTTGAGQDVGAAFAPDGRRLAFAVLRQNAELWRLPVEPATGRAAGRPEKVVAGTRENSRGCFSPDGALVAFNTDRSGEMNVWLFDLARRAPRSVTTGPGGDYQPRFSPDGTRLAFFSCREGQPDIFTVRLDGSGLERLTANGAINVNPVWSPDGTRIAYMSDVGGRLEVWTMGADGNGARALTEVGVMGHFLLFTHDGSHIVFRSPSSPPRTLQVGVGGGAAVPLGDVRGGAHMSFSQDASRIADVIAHKTIWVSPLTGGEPEPVFAFDDPDVRIDYPVWSPDGRWLLFDRVAARGGDVWILEAGG